MSEEFTKAKLFYQALLGFYPQPYRKVYGQEMKLLFEDLYQEEIAKNKGVSFTFWLNMIWDVAVNTISQHQNLLQKIGFKKYLQSAFATNTFVFLLGLLLLFPFLTLFTVDLGLLLLTGNRMAMAPFYNSPFWPPVILTVVLILPLITVLINGLVLIQSAKRTNYHYLTVSFIGQNFLNLMVVGVGLLAIFMLFGHDFIPCLVNQALKTGLQNFIPNLNYCRIYS